MIKIGRDAENKSSNLIKDINILLKAREGGVKSWNGRSGIRNSNQ